MDRLEREADTHLPEEELMNRDMDRDRALPERDAMGDMAMDRGRNMEGTGIGQAVTDGTRPKAIGTHPGPRISATKKILNLDMDQQTKILTIMYL